MVVPVAVSASGRELSWVEPGDYGTVIRWPDGDWRWEVRWLFGLVRWTGAKMRGLPAESRLHVAGISVPFRRRPARTSRTATDRGHSQGVKKPGGRGTTLVAPRPGLCPRSARTPVGIRCPPPTPRCRRSGLAPVPRQAGHVRVHRRTENEQADDACEGDGNPQHDRRIAAGRAVGQRPQHPVDHELEQAYDQ